MEPVLIYKNEEKIEAEIDYLGNVSDYLQSVYNEFLALGLTPTLKELSELCNAVTAWGSRPEHLANFVAEKLVDKAGTPNFNGVPIQRSKLKELISVPDLSALQATIKEYHQWKKDGFGFRINLLTLQNDLITINADAEDKLNEEYTYFTKTEQSAQMATKLNDICAALNAWQDTHSDIRDFAPAHEQEFIPGITARNREFVVDLKFIRDKERFLV